MNLFAMPIFFAAKLYTDFFAYYILLFEIKMWFGTFASCINREDKFLDIL